MTRRELAQWLENEHQRRSWRDVSQNVTDGRVPAGTLARIAKSAGKYVPNKWRAYFGITASKSRPSKAKRLADLPANVLKQLFEERTEF